MDEWKRIFLNRRLSAALLLILLLNGFLFIREQAVRDYGLDCTVPATVISFSMAGGSDEMAQTSVDSRDAYARYLLRLSDYKALPLADAISELEAEKERLTGILGISDLLRDTGDLLISDALEQSRAEQPELVEQLENGEIDLNEVRLDYVAASNLLAQGEYLDGYADYLDIIQANKEQMLSFSIFNDPNSFSGRNIVKTAEEFEALEDVSLELGSDGAVSAFLDFSITDYLLLCVLVLICASFLDERKKGLWSVVHAAPHGRLRLALKRAGILFGISVAGTLALYGMDLLIGFWIYGGTDDLGRAAQSVELLGKMPLRCTVGQFLLQYLLFKVAAAFLTALLLWLIFTAINHVKYTILAAAGLLVVEYSLYTFLPVQSGWNLFKYFNLFTFISLSDLYTNYLNIDLFSYPVGIRAVSQLACLPLILLLAAACITIHCRKKPVAGKDLLGRFVYGINRMADWFLRRFRLLGMELHKTLVIQKGFLIVLLFLCLASGLSFTVTIPVENSTDAAARQYMSELEGEITEDTLQRIDEVQAGLDEIIAVYEQAKAQYENGEMEYPQYDVFVREAEAAEIKGKGLGIVRDRVEELRFLGKEKGFTPWLIEESPYKGTYGENARANQQSAALVAMLTITLLLAGSFVYETQSGMHCLLASALRGRKKLLRRKIGLAAILTTGVWAVTYGLELHAFLGICEAGILSAPVQNLSMLANVPIVCSIGIFLIGLYLFRWLSLFTCAMLTMLISSYMKRMETACIAVCGVILLPSVLYLYVGLEPLKYLSLVLIVEGMPFLQVNELLVPLCLILGILIVLIGTSIYSLRRRLRI